MTPNTHLLQPQLYLILHPTFPFTQQHIHFHHHLIQPPINPQNPHKNFHPTPPPLHPLHLPQPFNLPLHSLLYQPYPLSPYYHSLLPKVIVKSTTPPQPIHNFKITLHQIIIHPFTTTPHFLYPLLSYPLYLQNDPKDLHIKFLHPYQIPNHQSSSNSISILT
ncbi:acetyl-CoA carboxylase biotin carboxylase subunit family protein [Staphylococcus auricularis]|uniref:hypothetical protein n=1 Tax=Staphylococcus auricularis TaxID=29379 RepID=UPI001CD9240C